MDLVFSVRQPVVGSPHVDGFGECGDVLLLSGVV